MLQPALQLLAQFFEHACDNPLVVRVYKAGSLVR